MNKILNIAEKGGKPVVPGCRVIPCDDGHYLAVEEQATLTPKGPHTGYHAIVARLWRAKAGVYFTQAPAGTLNALDPSGKTLQQYALSPSAGAWPCKDELDQSIRVPSALGNGDARPVKRIKHKPIDGAIARVIR